ncbi:MAG: SIMPL domain-containing protein [Chitinophagaceae bacterium]|nr:SIMPL domain-containing protein [Chitinophagaceae bacterium]
MQKCQSVGIADTLVSIASYEGSNYSHWAWRKTKKDPELYSNISYQIKFKDSKKMDALIDVLDDDVTSNFQVIKVSHSKILEYRKQLKIQAIRAAKEKGIYLTEAINEKLGEAITITEPSETNFSDIVSGRLGNVNSNVIREQKYESGGFGVDFKKFKLRYEVSMIFALK